MRKLVPVMFVLGCATDHAKPGPEVLPDLHLPPPPAEGMGWQLITPIVEDLQPSSDHEMCTWTDIVTDKDVMTKQFTGFQNEPPGHHVVAYYTMTKQPPGTTRECNDQDMVTFRFLAGAAGEGAPRAAPGNLMWPIPAGAQIVVNSHYLNTTDSVLRGQSAMNVDFVDPNGGPYVASGNLAIVDTGIDVPPGNTYTDDIHCVANKTLKLWYLIPHMHQWGKHINVDVTQAGVKTRAFSTDWDPAFQFHPPEETHDPTAPRVLSSGDAIDIHCEWNNDTGHDLAFGFEMCIAYAQFVDDANTGSIACDRGQWFRF